MDYVADLQARMEKNPRTYLEALRQANALHFIWHGELQNRIAKLEAENARLREELHGR